MLVIEVEVTYPDFGLEAESAEDIDSPLPLGRWSSSMGTMGVVTATSLMKTSVQTSRKKWPGPQSVRQAKGISEPAIGESFF